MCSDILIGIKMYVLRLRCCLSDIGTEGYLPSLLLCSDKEINKLTER